MRQQMNSPHKRPLTSKPDKPNRLREIANLIHDIDAVRAGHIFTYDKLKHSSIIEGETLKVVVREIQKKINPVKSSAYYSSLIKIASTLQIVYMQYFAIAFGLSLFSKYQNFPTSLIPVRDVIAGRPVMLGMICVFAGTISLQVILKKRLKKLFDANPIRGQRLKTFVQDQIDLLRREIRKEHADSKKILIKLYHEDYSNIEVKTRPGFLEKFYTAIVVP